MAGERPTRPRIEPVKPGEETDEQKELLAQSAMGSLNIFHTLAHYPGLLRRWLPFGGNQAAPNASDAEFLRRVSLDLTGVIPSAGEARAFLANPSATKRQQLIDRLLASPAYAWHMQDVFDVMLLERRRDRTVPQEQWQEFLRTSFAANKPWDQLVREILTRHKLHYVLLAGALNSLGVQPEDANAPQLGQVG